MVYVFEYKGGLGNILFITASGLGIGKRHSQPVYFHGGIRTFHATQDYYNNILHDVEKWSGSFQSGNTLIASNVYTDIPPLGESVTYVYEYLQNSRYFHDYPEIRDSLKAPLHHYLERIITDFPLYTSSAFIHVRKGDYNNWGKVLPVSYYENAIKQYPKGTHFYIIGEYRGDCSALTELVESCTICEGGDEVLYLALMAFCGKGGITANSTYSWWGGYFNTETEAKIVSPERWLIPHYDNPMTDKVSNWVLL